jgi:hypothetical protein
MRLTNATISVFDAVARRDSLSRLNVSATKTLNVTSASLPMQDAKGNTTQNKQPQINPEPVEDG